ncbi:hypothetical protein G3I60_05135 [Streptomyces sp. SID13666]|uniref:hypothetical protein n=1 Tax=Streptomyces sp. SID13666 TaxID=2706054 RepID=UPI0013BF86E0|nr:hypothetical protein [Streptomyces sp. SID13666]NEA53554.1 hypothetical protein [Streptomyces sp. SID13666]
MTPHRSDGKQISAELETLFTGMGLPIANTEDRSLATGVLITSVGARHATVEWFVSTTARNAAAREQTEGIADGRAVLFHRTSRNYMHYVLNGVLQELGYTLALTTNGAVQVDGDPGTGAGAETAQSLTESISSNLDNLDDARDRKNRGGDDDDGLAGVPARR